MALVDSTGWERSDFPIICETCLGDNPYVRMTKAEFDKECKVCTRPFTVFRWRPGSDARYKKTEVCQTCSKIKNVCQVCLLDLEYGLPVQVRDQCMPQPEVLTIPQSDANREYFANEADGKVAAGDLPYGKYAPSDTLLKLARTTPYYKRNRSHVCSFFVKGECTRGSECPYRHEMPETGELSVQNIKDRYYGVNDPVANKLLRKADDMPGLKPPDDQTITTLYVGGINDTITEADLRDQFYSHGELKSIRMVYRSRCAFIQYTTRKAAEEAAEKLSNRLLVKGVRLKLMWGKPQVPSGPTPDATASAQLAAAVSSSSSAYLSSIPPPPSTPAFFTLPPPPGPPPLVPSFGSLAPPVFRPPGMAPSGQIYPSQDPAQMGSHSKD